MTAPNSDEFEREMLEAEGAEALKARLEREHNELLQELRSLIPGANVLLGFLLAVSFTSQFGDLTRTERCVYFATLVSTAVALVLFLAPAAHHRLRFREGDKDNILRKGNREAIAGTVASSLAFTGVLYLVTERIFGTPEAILMSGRVLRLHRVAVVELRAPAHGARRTSAQPPLGQSLTLAASAARNARTSPGPTRWTSSRRPVALRVLGSSPPT